MYKNHIKRLIDIIIALIGLIVFSPMLIVISLLIAFYDYGPIFFKQKRIAKNKNGNKQYFKMYKFRTMKLNTPHDMPTHLLENPDKYITSIGAFLRKTSLDELPQIINILKGDMSVIGPRPALWNQDDLYNERERYAANDIRPGLTGWAQINGRDELEIKVKAKLDGEYANTLKKGKLNGFIMDIKCFFITIISVLKSDGVVEGGTGKEKNKKIISSKNYEEL